VLQCAEDGDLVAFKIVTTAADEAVRAAETVAAKTKLKGQRFTMVLSGGRSLSSGCMGKRRLACQVVPCQSGCDIAFDTSLPCLHSAFLTLLHG
jgi:hypothetical protein